MTTANKNNRSLSFQKHLIKQNNIKVVQILALEGKFVEVCYNCYCTTIFAISNAKTYTLILCFKENQLFTEQEVILYG